MKTVERLKWVTRWRPTSRSIAVNRYHPTDEELEDWLKRRIHNLPLSCDMIKEVELYRFDPSELLALF
ncbi:hypothetical protein AAC387_Pa05g2645 [Persea americana]